ncbi:UNVERIFIED_CONTAM: hypothetical protein K2H54_040232 [Gekko kuhli]
MIIPTGPVSYEVLTDCGQILCKHVDQLRRRMLPAQDEDPTPRAPEEGKCTRAQRTGATQSSRGMSQLRHGK